MNPLFNYIISYSLHVLLVSPLSDIILSYLSRNKILDEQQRLIETMGEDINSKFLSKTDYVDWCATEVVRKYAMVGLVRKVLQPFYFTTGNLQYCMFLMSFDVS